jgi:CheY-like chemotaxis protein
MDLTMPRMDGRQAFVELRRIRGDVRVVLMSGFNEQEALSQFSGKGLAGFLPKPFQFDQVSETLRRALTDEAK